MVLEVECASNNLRKITKNSSNVGHTNCSERALTGFGLVPMLFRGYLFSFVNLDDN